jgi:hypothetical protein
LRESEEFAHRAVNNLEHLGNFLALMILDIDAGGKRALAAAPEHEHVDVSLCNAGI